MVRINLVATSGHPQAELLDALTVSLGLITTKEKNIRRSGVLET